MPMEQERFVARIAAPYAVDVRLFARSAGDGARSALAHCTRPRSRREHPTTAQNDHYPGADIDRYGAVWAPGAGASVESTVECTHA
jgi:hypothetical protein